MKTIFQGDNMAKKTEQMSVRMDLPTKKAIDNSDLTLIQIIEKGLESSKNEIPNEKKVSKMNFARNPIERQDMVMQLQNCLEYKGLQDMQDGTGKYFRIEFNGENCEFTKSQIISIFFYSLNQGTPIITYSKGFAQVVENKFVLEELLLEFTYNPDVLPTISLHLTKNNLLEYIDFIFHLCEIIDSITIKLSFCVLWCDTYRESDEDEEITRGNLNSWRKEVLKEGVCACCGGDKYLEAHHIMSFNSYPHLRDDVNNGVALCKWCHKKLHSYYGKEPTPLDLANFFNRFGTINGGIQNESGSN